MICGGKHGGHKLGVGREAALGCWQDCLCPTSVFADGVSMTICRKDNKYRYFHALAA